MKKKFCTLVTKLTFGKVCFGWCVEPIEPKKEVKKTPKKKTTKKEKSSLVLEKKINNFKLFNIFNIFIIKPGFKIINKQNI